MASSTYTIEEYLRGKLRFTLSDESIASVLFDRGIDSGTAASAVSQRLRELCWADLIMLCAYGPSSGTGEYNSDGGWVHQDGTQNVSDPDDLLSLARAIYHKWGDDAAEDGTTGGITLKSLY